MSRTDAHTARAGLSGASYAAPAGSVRVSLPKASSVRCSSPPVHATVPFFTCVRAAATSAFVIPRRDASSFTRLLFFPLTTPPAISPRKQNATASTLP